MAAEPWTDADRRAMARALVLADLGRATVRPNPLVGCVIVRDGEVVGDGWHERAGGPHAEVAALRAAGEAAHGATAYVTLEPCDHQGRTGPCTQALLEAGVSRVVFAVEDPDPEARGGADTLRAAGVAVSSGLLGEWAAIQNEVYLHARRAGRPFVTLKLAQTLDGGLHTPRGARFITGTRARTSVHRLRRESDAVMVGSQTVLDDDPALSVRHVDAPHGQPRAIVLDSRGRTPVGAALISERGRREGDPPTLVLTTERSDPAWRSVLQQHGADVELVDASADGRVDPAAALATLLARDVQHVLLEGGETLTRAFVQRSLVDRLVLHIALTVVGPVGLPGVTPAVEPPAGSWAWSTQKVGRLGPDLEVVAVPTLPADRR